MIEGNLTPPSPHTAGLTAGKSGGIWRLGFNAGKRVQMTPLTNLKSVVLNLWVK